MEEEEEEEIDFSNFERRREIRRTRRRLAPTDIHCRGEDPFCMRRFSHRRCKSFRLTIFCAGFEKCFFPTHFISCKTSHPPIRGKRRAHENANGFPQNPKVRNGFSHISAEKDIGLTLSRKICGKSSFRRGKSTDLKKKRSPDKQQANILPQCSARKEEKKGRTRFSLFKKNLAKLHSPAFFLKYFL